MLLVHRNRAVSGSVLMDVLWGDSPPAGARGSFHSKINRLRKLLDEEFPHDADWVLDDDFIVQVMNKLN